MKQDQGHAIDGKTYDVDGCAIRGSTNEKDDGSCNTEQGADAVRDAVCDFLTNSQFRGHDLA